MEPRSRVVSTPLEESPPPGSGESRAAWPLLVMSPGLPWIRLIKWFAFYLVQAIYDAQGLEAFPDYLLQLSSSSGRGQGGIM